MRLLRPLLLIVLVLALPAMAVAQDDARGGALDRGIEAVRRGDYAAAVRHFRDGVAAGDVRAAFNLGYLHDNGWGVPRDGMAAQELYIAGAQAGLVMAQNNLAYLWGRQGGLLAEALCLSARTLEHEPDNPFFLDTYGFILLRLGRSAPAEAYFRKALRWRPDYADALEHLGDAAAMRDDAGQARDWWRRANANPRDDRQAARIAAKLGGAPPPGDLNAHPPFTLRNPGLPAECGTPMV